MLVSDLIPCLPPQETTSPSGARGMGDGARSQGVSRVAATFTTKAKTRRDERASSRSWLGFTISRPLLSPPVKRLCLPGEGPGRGFCVCFEAGDHPGTRVSAAAVRFQGPKSTPELFLFFTDEKTCSTSTCKTETRHRLSFLLMLPRCASCDHGSMAGLLYFSHVPLSSLSSSLHL